MKRLLLASVGALMLPACGGGGGSVVGANSSDSTEITAVGTIVGNAASGISANNSAVDNAAAAVATAAADNAAISQDAAGAGTHDDLAAPDNDSGQ